MAIESEGTGNGFYMPVAPAYAGNSNGGFGGWGDGGWWILLLFILLGNGNWGNNGMGGGFGGGMGGLYPWMNQAQITTDGFQNSLMNDNITSIRDGVFGLSTQLCNGFAQAEIAANARQMADMQQTFGLQTALSNCCCENRLGTADLKATVISENCSDRAVLSDGIRDIMAANSANTQRILDQLCADKIDAKNDEIAQLRQELLYSRGQASQIAQNATIIDGIYNRLDSCPVGTTPVYGRTPIFQCNSGCGCGCNGGNF